MADYVRIIRRGWWIVVATLVLVTAVTYFVSSRQAPLYQATADDLITTLDLSNPTSNSHTSSGSAQQYVQTMAQVAQSEQVAAAALAKAPKVAGMTPRKLLKASTVTADPNATIVSFNVSYRTKAGAVALTNAYAQAFAEFSKQQQTKRVNTLITQAQATAAS